MVSGCVIAAAAVYSLTASPGYLTVPASGVVAAVSVIQQAITAYAAVLGSPGMCGRILGLVTSGVVFDVLLDGIVTGLIGDVLD